MNYDRLLTRVFDKQEKKMIYKHQEFVYDGVKYIFESVTNDAVIASEYIPILSVCQIICLELEDRFIPMQCIGLKDKNSKLIYGEDIIKYKNIIAQICFNEEQACFECHGKYLDYKKVWSELCYSCSRLCETEIIGNKFENEKLLEVKV